MNAAVVKRINTGSKLIPVVLDNLDHTTDVPAPIRHLLLEYVPDTDVLDEVLDRVVRSIFGQVDRPPLGARPLFATTPAVRVSGLDRIDSLVFAAAGSEAIRDDGDTFETAEFVEAVAGFLEVTEEQVAESLDILHAEHLVKLSRVRASTSPRFVLTSHGLRTYLQTFEPEWPRWEATVIARLAAWPMDQGTEQELLKAVGDVPRIVVRMILDRLDHSDLRLSKPVGGPQGWRFLSISPRLRRRASQ
jgi:hypothetical protein